MRRHRPVLAATLTAAVALPLAACGGPHHSETAAPAARTVVDVWLADYPFPGYLDARKKLAAEFGKRHPEYEVKVTAHNFAELPLKVARAAAEGRAPAVADYYYNATQLARDARDKDGAPLFTSVGKAIGGRSEILGEPVVTADTVRAVGDYYQSAGDLDSMPVTAMTSIMYANKKLLDAAGVTGMPKTWADIETACKKIAALPKGPQHCVTWPNQSWFFQQAVAQQGGLLTGPGNGRPDRATRTDLDSKAMLAYVTWWQRLHRSGSYLYTGAQNDWGGNFEAFTSQKVAFAFDSANQGGPLAEAGRKAGFEVRAARLPHNEKVPRSGNLTSGDSLWLAAKLDKKTRDGALAFMQYLNSPQNAADWHKKTQYLPMTEGAISRLGREGWFEANPASRVALDQIHATEPGRPGALGAVAGGFDGIQNQLTGAMHDVLTRKADPAERFARADTAAQRILDDYNSHCIGKGLHKASCYTVGAFG